MKKEFYSIKKPKWGLIALFMTFCCLFGNTAAAQAVSPSSSATNDLLVWTGNISSEWNDAGNWYVQSRATTGVAGTSLYPGQVELDDWAIIPSNGANPPIITSGQTINIGRVSITNQFNAAGATLTINSGGTVNLANALSGTIVLAGGSIVNNGALNINTSGVGFTNFPTYAINCATPNNLPAVPTEWGYSGSGTLSINLSAANFAGAGAIVVTGINSTNVTYRMVLNNPTITLNQATNLGISAIRANGGVNANKLIIAGTGVTLGTVGSPVKGGLLNVGSIANVTVEAGTTLTLHSAATNANVAITGGNSANNIPTEFVNKGTINVLGSSTRSGLLFSTFGGTQSPAVQSPNASIVNFTNEGTITIDLDISAIGSSAFNVGNGGGGTANAGSIGNLINTSTGTITLKNRSTIVGTGFAITATVDGQAPKAAFINSGTLNLESSVYHYGAKMSITNTGIINTNNELRGFSPVNNNAGGSINFVRTAATATNKLVTFNGLPTANAAAPGAVYTDGTNNYTVVISKYGATNIITNVVTSASTASISTTSGTLTLVSGTGAATQTYTATAAVIDPPAAAIPSFSASSAKGALTSGTSGGGTINTDTGSDYLNSLSGLSAVGATGTVSPGGSAGKGIAEINRYEWFGVYGTAKIQVSGNTTAGVDYDQLNNALGGIDVSAGTLDVTGIYTPSGTLASPIDIISAGSTQPLVGSFTTVTGLTPGWSVNYTGTESIDPMTSAPYVPTRRESGKVQLAYVQTPIITQLSSNGTDTITQGCEGSTLVILGSKFTGATGVTVNGVALSGVTVVSDTRIDAVLPMGATSGVVAVTGSEAVGSSTGNFTVVVNSTNTTTASSFQTYTWANNGQTYTTGGIKTGTTTNCVTELLDLTITTTQIPASFPAFCKGATVASATAGTTMLFYAAATGGLPLAGTTALGNAKTYFVTEVINSVETTTRLARVITVNNLPATPSLLVSSPVDESKLICKYIGSTTPVTFNVTATGAVSYIWTAPAGASIVSGDTTSSVGISFAGASATPGAIGAVTVKSVDTNGCASLAKSLTITTKVPTAPTSLTMTSADSTPHFDVAVAPATIPATFNTVGLNTLSKITKVGPYMGTSTVFTLTAPVAPTAASYQWTLNGGTQLSGGTSNVITVDFAGVTAGIGSLPIVVKSVGGCGLSTARTLTLGRTVPGAPKALALTSSNTTPRFTGVGGLVGLNTLTKIAKVGPYQSTTLGFTLTATPFKVQGATATSYAWILPAGVVCTTSNTTTTVFQNVNNGTAEAPIIVSTAFAAIKTTSNTIDILFNTTGTGNLDLLVFAVNGAGNSVARKLVVTRSLPTAPTKLVLTDGATVVTKASPYVGKPTVLTLTGTPFTTQGAEGRKFFWKLPAGVNVLSGVIAAELTTPPVTDVDGFKTWTSAFTSTSSGMVLTVNLAGIAPGVTSIPLSVASQNEAGTSATSRSLTLTAAAPTAPAIVGSTGTTYSSCANTTYTATSFQGATYAWTIPADAAIVGATDGNVIVVNYAGVSVPVGGSAAVTCIATNGVGSSPAKSLTVKRVAASCREASTAIAKEYSVKAYPNPSSSEFTIETSAKGAMNVKVYDMQGRLVEKANSDKVGSKLAAGAYNVIVNQGTNTKSVRVIKN